MQTKGINETPEDRLTNGEIGSLGYILEKIKQGKLPFLFAFMLLIGSLSAQNYTAISLANQSFCDNFGDGGSCDHGYNENWVQIATMEGTENWLSSGTNATVANDTTNYKEGSQGMAFTDHNYSTQIGYYTLPSPISLDTYSNITVWIYGNWSDIVLGNTLRLYTNATAYWVFTSVGCPSSGTSWCYINKAKTEATAVAGATSWSTITRVAATVFAANGNVSATFDDLRAVGSTGQFNDTANNKINIVKTAGQIEIQNASGTKALALFTGNATINLAVANSTIYASSKAISGSPTCQILKNGIVVSTMSPNTTAWTSVTIINASTTSGNYSLSSTGDCFFDNILIQSHIPPAVNTTDNSGTFTRNQSLECSALTNSSDGEIVCDYYQNDTINQTAKRMVAYYPFDAPYSNATFTQDKAITPTANGTVSGATWTSNGKIGGAYEFDAYTTYINSTTNFPHLDVLTATAWVYPKTGQRSTVNTVVGKHYTGTEGEWSLSVLSNYTSLLITNASLTRVICTPNTNPVPKEQWSFIAATYNGSLISVYMNGNLTGTCAQVGAIQTTTHQFCVGMKHCLTAASDTFNGSIDEVKIYNVSLTATEISQIYTDGMIGKTLPAITATAATTSAATDATTSHSFLINGTYNLGAANLTWYASTITGAATQSSQNITYASINAYNVSSTLGTCTQTANSSVTGSFSVQYNCTSTTPGNTTVTIGFTDTTGAYTSATSATHAYPDHAASLTKPSTNASLTTLSTATCTNGTYLDIDGDTENTSARTWLWYKNGVAQAGNISQMLLLSAVGAVAGDNISCSENATNSTWTASYAWNISSNTTVTQDCGTLGTAGASYALTKNVSINGSTCFTVTAANVTLDCAGFSVTGNNSSSTYGIYSSQFNTTIKNCNISNFAYAIQFSGANGTIDSTNGSTTFTGAHAITVSGSNNTVSNTIGSAASNKGIMVNGGSNNIINNSTGTSITNVGISVESSTNAIIVNSNGSNSGSGTTGYGIRVTSSANNIQIIDSTASSAAATAIYIDGGSNVSVDCQGKSLVGTNTSGTYGIYSNQTNTTIKNCNISNFATGVYFVTSANNGTIDNVNATTTKAISGNDGVGILLETADYNTVSNSVGNGGYGIRVRYAASDANAIVNSVGIGAIYGIIAGGTGTTITSSSGTSSSTGIGMAVVSGINVAITNSTANATSDKAIYITSASHGTQVIGSTAFSGSSSAIYIDSGSNVSIDCQGKSLTGTNTSSTYGIYSTQVNTTIRNCNISNFQRGVYLVGASSSLISGNTISSTNMAPLRLDGTTGCTFQNNTLSHPTSTLLTLNSTSSNNTFYWNNFTSTAGVYVNDSNGSNSYNTTGQGNIYPEVFNGSLYISGTVPVSWLAGYYYGSKGTQYPFNSTFSAKMVDATDYAPITPYTNFAPVGNASIPQTTAYTTTILQGMANVTDYDAVDNMTYNYSWLRNGINVQNGTIGSYTQGMQVNIANYTGTQNVADNITFQIIPYDQTVYGNATNSSTITILNANFSNGSVAQTLATANQPVRWDVTVTVYNGTGTCNYSILQIAVQNSTNITNSTGGAVANTGNYTNPSWNCSVAASPYNVRLYTEANNQTDGGSVAYGIQGTNQRRISIMANSAQNITYLFQYSVDATHPYLFMCSGATNASCGVGASWYSTTFSYGSSTISKTITLSSNETVLAVTWDNSGGSGGNYVGGGSSTVEVANTSITTNGTFVQYNATSPQAQGQLTIEVSPVEQFLAAAGEFGVATDRWASSQTYVGDLGFGNWIIADGLLGILVLLSIVLYYSSKADKKPPAYILAALFFGICMAYVTFKYMGGVAA